MTTLPVERCCRSIKEKETERTDEPETQPINEGGEQINSSKIFEAGSVENNPDRTSLISDPDSDGEDDLQIPGLTAD